MALKTIAFSIHKKGSNEHYKAIMLRIGQTEALLIYHTVYFCLPLSATWQFKSATGTRAVLTTKYM